MDAREKLVELIVWIEDQMTRAYPYTTDQFRIETTVDHLIANGVTVQELDGCEYCNDGSIIYNADEEFYISGNTLRVDIGCHCYSQVKINFCPMCGRRLHLPKPTTQKSNS